MKIRDLFSGCNRAFRSSEPTFETRLLYAQLSSQYDCNADSKWGYIDASKELLETYRPIEELETYIDEYETIEGNNTEYDKAYVQAYRDYIKQEQKARATNE